LSPIDTVPAFPCAAFAELAEFEDPHALIAAAAPRAATARQTCRRFGDLTQTLLFSLLFDMLSSSRVSACPVARPGRQHEPERL
jgi:hypothetical protein